MARRRSSSPAAGLLGVLLLVGLVVMIIKWLLITAAILAVPFGIWWVYDRSRRGRAAAADHRLAQGWAARRADVESRAVVDAAGGCGWCGSRVVHVDDYTGRVLTPRQYHHDEVERAIVGV